MSQNMQFNEEIKFVENLLLNDVELYENLNANKGDINNKIKTIISSAIELCSSKDHDYSGGSSMGNLKSSVILGISPWIAVLLRMNDKINRVISLLEKKQTVLSEKIEDTFLDLANYSIFASILFQENYKNKNYICSLFRLLSADSISCILLIPDFNCNLFLNRIENIKKMFLEIAEFSKQCNVVNKK